MKKSIGWLVLLLAGLFSNGCIIRSLHPWLSDESQVSNTPLLGGWHDAQKGSTVFFTEDASSNLAVLVVSQGKETSRFKGSLHQVDRMLLLQVGPEDRTDLGAFATLPGMLLYRVDLKKNRLQLFEPDLDGFEERAAAAKLPVLPESSKSNGYVLLASTGMLEDFVKAQLATPDFFHPTPYLSLRKLPE